MAVPQLLWICAQTPRARHEGVWGVNRYVAEWHAPFVADALRETGLGDDRKLLGEPLTAGHTLMIGTVLAKQSMVADFLTVLSPVQHVITDFWHFIERSPNTSMMFFDVLRHATPQEPFQAIGARGGRAPRKCFSSAVAGSCVHWPERCRRRAGLSSRAARFGA